MRVFFAINFERPVKDQIYKIIEKIQPYSIKGRFVSKDNLHLTLEFMGEINEAELYVLKDVLNNVNSQKFTINLTELDYFKTRKGRLYWLGIEKITNL